MTGAAASGKVSTDADQGSRARRRRPPAAVRPAPPPGLRQSAAMRLIDVEHLGNPRVIGCWELDGVLIDPGPELSMGTLLAALGGEEPRALLLTHIHLDHAGAAGSLVRRFPQLPVYVHRRGARHLADPTKLLTSAGQLYGDQMNRLWGEVAPVPEENLRPLSGGEEVLGFLVADTPGHAFHHLSYLHLESGRAFVGDTAATRIPPSNFILPPTPPPGIELELWEDSLDLIAGWRPESLGLTHFGAVADPEEHLEAVRLRLREQGERARRWTPPSSSGACARTSPARPAPKPPPLSCRRFRPSSSGPACTPTGAGVRPVAPRAERPGRSVRPARGSVSRSRRRRHREVLQPHLPLARFPGRRPGRAEDQQAVGAGGAARRLSCRASLECHARVTRRQPDGTPRGSVSARARSRCRTQPRRCRAMPIQARRLTRRASVRPRHAAPT
ncbi:MAG: MBL fold metallo-hydrolase [Solirubrobacterales bacterium]|nr:MBL fold metallo-hydrolase [Solirubrobacterales bacterium]